MINSKMLQTISHIKNGSKRKVSCQKILSNLKKRENSINKDDFKLNLEKLVAAQHFSFT